MLIPVASQSAIQERLIRNRSGVLMRVRFVIAEVDGVMRGRVISVEPVIALAGTTGKSHDNVFALPCAVTKKSVSHTWTSERIILSPFSPLDLLTNIKIRAPAFA